MKVSRFSFNMFGINTYILWDDISKEAVIIDPGMINDAERKSIDEFIELKGLHLKCLINTMKLYKKYNYERKFVNW